MINIRYEITTIKQIDSDYLDVIDRNGSSHRISFAECTVGWLEYVRKSSDFNTESQDLTMSKCVAITHKISPDIFIEFFSNPRVKLTFEFSLKLLRPGKAFDHVKNLIHAKGWKTYDIS
jgi:hypothetical protein